MQSRTQTAVYVFLLFSNSHQPLLAILNPVSNPKTVLIPSPALGVNGLQQSSSYHFFRSHWQLAVIFRTHFLASFWGHVHWWDMGRHILSLQRKGSHHNDLVLHSQFPPLLKQIIVKFYNINGEALSLCLFLWCACQCLFGHFISPVKNSLQFMGVVSGVPWHPRFPSTDEGKRGCHGKKCENIFQMCKRAAWSRSCRQGCKNKQEPRGSPLCFYSTIKVVFVFL